MSKLIFLDTNNWIYLSNGFNILSNKHDDLHFKIFDIIKKRVHEGSIAFLVNDIVLTEWHRNKSQTENQIQDLKNRYTSYKNTLNAIKDFIEEDVAGRNEVQSLLKKKFNQKVERQKEHIKNVEKFLLHNTIKISISDKTKIEACNLALEKKAPFIGDKKNSMADALILLSSIEHIEENEKMCVPYFEEDDQQYCIYPESYFVSSNKGDFSDPNDKEKLHPDLISYLQKTQTKFYYTLSKLINLFEEEFLTREEAEVLEHLDDSVYCEVCDYQHLPTIQFSNYFEILDPNKKILNINQLKIEFPNVDFNEKNVEENNLREIKIRTAECSNCGVEYLECTCGELVRIEKHNKKFKCVNGCGISYIAHADVDKKGIIHGDIYFEITKDYLCQKCGQETDDLNDSGLCIECEDFYINN